MDIEPPEEVREWVHFIFVKEYHGSGYFIIFRTMAYDASDIIWGESLQSETDKNVSVQEFRCGTVSGTAEFGDFVRVFFGYGLDDFKKNWSAGKYYEQFQESEEAEDFIAKRASSRNEKAGND